MVYDMSSSIQVQPTSTIPIWGVILKNPMENSNTVICFSKTDGFENPPQKIDGFGRTRRTPSDDSTVYEKP